MTDVELRHVKADFHNHLTTFRKVRCNFNYVVDLAHDRLGPGGILGVTNFASSNFEQFSEKPGYNRTHYGNAFYVEEKDILVVKTDEIDTKDGHVLAIGLERKIGLTPQLKIEETLQEIKRKNGLAGIDHPFYKSGIVRNLTQDPQRLQHLWESGLIDFYELHNECASLWIPKMAPAGSNKKSEEYYYLNRLNEYGIAPLSSTDSHLPYESARNYSYLPMPLDYTTMKNSLDVTNNISKSLKSIAKHSAGDGRRNSPIGGAIHAVLLYGFHIPLLKRGIEL